MAGETGAVMPAVLRWASVLSLFAAVSLAPARATPSPAAKAEIAGLMDALSASGCRFQRNGSWHGATEARAHLQRKYDYLLEKNQVDTAEQFIERVASKSSISGRAYRVKCGGGEQDASTWFDLQLKRLRDSGAAAR
ncbi:MAG TPA: DUF5329 domain-containing protein [Pseudoxanthomonas sp.]